MPGWHRHEVLTIGDTPVHAAVAGPDGAPLVVAVHGLGCSHRYFGRLAEALAPEVQVVAPDLPGCGRTPGPRRALDVAELAAVLGEWAEATGRLGAAMVANSAGCQVVAELARQRAGAVGPVVLVGPTMDRAARSWWRQAARFGADVPREHLALALVQVPDYLRCGPRRLAATFGHLLADPVEQHLPHLTEPAVVVRGAHDPVAPLRWAEEVAAAMGDATVTEVSHAAHGVHHSHPAEVAEIVRVVLRRAEVLPPAIPSR
jgi:pimeloyl-ACP methyl ester carboxylesterase